jgi:excisionase family DNA binding protein
MAAQQLGVHPKTIRRYINSGKISAQKIGGSWRIYESSMEAYKETCSSGDCHGDEISKDDFCIFMDSNHFDSSNNLQICTIADYYVQGGQVKNLLKDVMEVVADYSLENNNSRFNYIYDDADQKMRLVFWGLPSYMSLIMDVMKNYEK